MAKAAPPGLFLSDAPHVLRGKCKSAGKFGYSVGIHYFCSQVHDKNNMKRILPLLLLFLALAACTGSMRHGKALKGLLDRYFK